MPNRRNLSSYNEGWNDALDSTIEYILKATTNLNSPLPGDEENTVTRACQVYQQLIISLIENNYKGGQS